MKKIAGNKNYRLMKKAWNPSERRWLEGLVLSIEAAQAATNTALQYANTGSIENLASPGQWLRVAEKEIADSLVTAKNLLAED